MSYDPIILRRWPEILPTLDELGLEARHDLGNPDGGDRIVIHRAGETETGEPLGTIRFISGGWYRGHADAGEVGDGPHHRTILEAFEDVIQAVRSGI